MNIPARIYEFARTEREACIDVICGNLREHRSDIVSLADTLGRRLSVQNAVGLLMTIDYADEVCVRCAVQEAIHLRNMFPKNATAYAAMKQILEYLGKYLAVIKQARRRQSERAPCLIP